MIDLYILSTANLDDPRVHQEWKEKLPDGRWEKAVRLVSPKERKNSAGAGWLMSYAFREKGIPLDKKYFSLGKHGKPEHALVHFNLSHSGEYAVCAMAKKEVGCDIQKITAAREKIMRRFFSPEEERYVWQGKEPGEKEPDTKAERFTRIWTRKESYVKRTGEGLTQDLREIPCLGDRDFYEWQMDGYILTICHEDVGKKPDFSVGGKGKDREDVVRIHALDGRQMWGID